MKDLVKKLGFSKPMDVGIEILLDEEDRKTISIPSVNENSENIFRKIPLYTGEEDIKGKLIIRPRSGKVDHSGIRIRLVGVIEVVNGSQPDSEFMTNGQDVEPAGVLFDQKQYDFSFTGFQKPYDSFYGTSFRIKYVIRAGIYKNRNDIDVYKEFDIGVISPLKKAIPASQPILMEVGIDNLLNIIIDIPKNIFELKDFIEGVINFSLIKMTIQKMDFLIIRKEIIGIGDKAIIQTEEVNSFEVMDGSPINGILIRGSHSN